MSEPRQMTPEECREKFFAHIGTMFRSWNTISNHLVKPGQTDAEARMEGFLFSLLVMFDCGSMALPALKIAPAPHPDDERYFRDHGENWWPTGVVINDCQMHESFPWENLKSKGPGK